MGFRANDVAISRFLKETTSDLAEVMAFRVENAAYRMAPEETGDLKSTIRTETPATDASFSDRAERYVVAGGIPGKVSGEVVDYALYVEVGTEDQVAQPYMRPALDEAL
jgi:HK97 gp10 family phage protein